MRGINLGSGKKWSHPEWRGLDELDGNHLNESTRLPFEDEKVRYVFSSHFFEHINNDVAKNLKNDINFFKNVIGFGEGRNGLNTELKPT